MLYKQQPFSKGSPKKPWRGFCPARSTPAASGPAWRVAPSRGKPRSLASGGGGV